MINMTLVLTRLNLVVPGRSWTDQSWRIASGRLSPGWGFGPGFTKHIGTLAVLLRDLAGPPIELLL